ncbi:hypothetical protein COCC4DRAFT_33663 [Bipolaris maydis ATCC 48331]|uniref:Uncharacterized protein n=2 Tax=Cochliobolus heterostrophus TaxID=5016 RepID=M2SKW5_COCH5|nr:uncharacterized protein COCC4DRAFT_33663 [Bipolaris maydis ATCC 48331]EMD85950.1 hypothetical protein COCHEDRAFT_1024187 [Bipolaris maydis C5]KAH7562887.1 hypothetical protein BM1_02407 [Bipolaris maydis]ENI01953.1 hypothetical protein COCC4DRAFT_33663 [Bipolaris maydis ATCC 48331]KAJ5028263.1 hypothetical protein J3E73DRAFT_299835 [Bipolaris maydis]KAJ5063045.1 hypothetical protein J3E74DRAFT_326785 [Bipolaris maydis]
MSASLTFYDATVPVMCGISKSAIGFLTAAKEELSKENANLPSESDVLNAQLGDMLPFRMQPIILSKFQLVGIQTLKLAESATAPNLDPSTFSSFDDVISFFKQLLAVLEAVDANAYNESAEKGVDVEIGPKTLHMSTLKSFTNDFVVPNSYFHLNAMYMILRSKGFSLGKSIYIGGFMSEQSIKDWAPLRA